MNANDFPHGECECRDGCGCERRPGPAAFVVERDGKDVKVCTRCDFSHDKNKRLLVTDQDSASVYHHYDALGALCIVFKLAEAAEKAAAS